MAGSCGLGGGSCRSGPKTAHALLTVLEGGAAYRLLLPSGAEQVENMRVVMAQ